MDQYQQQELIEAVSDALGEDLPEAAIALIADAYRLDLIEYADRYEPTYG